MSRSSKAVTPDAVTTMMRGASRDSLVLPSLSGSSFPRRWCRDAMDAMDDMDAVDAVEPGSALAVALRPQHQGDTSGDTSGDTDDMDMSDMSFGTGPRHL